MKTGKRTALFVVIGLLVLSACAQAANQAVSVTLPSPTAGAQPAYQQVVYTNYTIKPPTTGDARIVYASFVSVQAQATIEATLVPTVVVPTIEMEVTEAVTSEATIEVTATKLATEIPTQEPTATFTHTPTVTPSPTFTPSPTPTNTPTPTPTATPTATLIPYEVSGSGRSIDGLPPGVYFLAPQPPCYRPGVAVWIRVQPLSFEWNLTVQMRNVTSAQAWLGYKDAFVGQLQTTLDPVSQIATVRVPAGTKEFLMWFTQDHNCDYMGVVGNVTDAPPVVSVPQPAAIVPTLPVIQPTAVPPTAPPFDGTSNI